MSDAEERATQAASGIAPPNKTAASRPAGHTEDSPTQEVTSTTLTSAANTSAIPFERLSSSLNQSSAKETPPAGKTKVFLLKDQASDATAERPKAFQACHSYSSEQAAGCQQPALYEPDRPPVAHSLGLFTWERLTSPEWRVTCA